MIVLDSGIFKLQTGTLVLDSNATIYINGGTFTASTASVNLKSVYNVYYGKASYLSGVELMGLGLNDVTVNVTSGNTVKLLSNLTTNGTLYLMSGTLVLNSNNLTLNGYFMSSDSLGGDIHSTAGSVINVFTKGSTTGGSIHFAANGNTVSKMNINSANSADYIALFSDLKVIDTLTLANGKIKMMGGNVLEIASTGRIAGGGVSSYIVTSASSYLRLNLSANDSNAKQYIIGTIANYAPAYIKLNSGSPDGTVDIGVDKGVFTNGASGDNLTTYQSTVNATWFLNSNITNNLSLNLSVNWSSDMELNNFDRSKSFISHYSNYHWDTFATSSASVYSNGTFASVRTNITSLSPFTVFDQSTNTGIANANNNVDVTIFPNPASDNMNVNIADMNLTGNSFHMEILDLTGRIINESILEAGNNSININSLINGNYIIKIYDAKTVTVRKFNKI